jgi:hypothetical protein
VPKGPVYTFSGTANLDFVTGSSALIPTFGRNAAELDAIDEPLGRIGATPGSTLVAITITGYSSPDGRYDTNASLAWDRATALSRYLQVRHSIPPGLIRIRAVGENWSALRTAVVENAGSWPSEVMTIIDSPDAPDAKESRLRRLENGRVWQRMEREIFPQLRKVDYTIDYNMDN